MKWNHRFRGFTMFVFNFSVVSLEQSVKLGRLVIFDFLGNSLLWTPLFPNRKPKSNAFYNGFVVRAVFQLLYCCWGSEINLIKCRPLFCSQIFSATKCCDIQGPHSTGYLWVSLFINQSEYLVCYIFALNYLKTAFILTNQNWVIFSCTLLMIEAWNFLQHLWPYD